MHLIINFTYGVQYVSIFFNKFCDCRIKDKLLLISNQKMGVRFSSVAFAPVAQLAERLICNQNVGSSILLGGYSECSSIWIRTSVS